MGDLGGLTSQLTPSSFGRDVKLGVPCLDAACTVGPNKLSVARNPDKPTQNKLKTKQNSKRKNIHGVSESCKSVENSKIRDRKRSKIENAQQLKPETHRRRGLWGDGILEPEDPERSYQKREIPQERKAKTQNCTSEQKSSIFVSNLPLVSALLFSLTPCALF